MPPFFKPLAVYMLVKFAGCAVLELKLPAYQVDRRARLLADVSTIALLLAVTAPLVDYALGSAQVYAWLPVNLGSWPLALRILTYVVLADLCHYFLHRLLHLPALFRLHQWHHAPDNTGFLTGYRQSLLDSLVITTPYVLLWPVLGRTAPWWVSPALIAFAAARNDWMHLNVSWGARWLEWCLVTPRYHHIHHSDAAAHYGKNLCVFFSCWDHLFGTYYDPSGTTGKLSFGIGKRPSFLRLFFGW